MKRVPLLLMAMLFGACAGNQYTTITSPPQPTRSFEPVSAIGELIGPPQRCDKYLPDRVYLITRPDTAYATNSQWRAQGNTIREAGSRIEFVDLDSGQNVAIDDPHQVTPMASRTDRPVVNYPAEIKPPPANRDSPVISSAGPYP